MLKTCYKCKEEVEDFTMSSYREVSGGPTVGAVCADCANNVKKCIVCKKPVDWEMVKEEFEDTFNQADHYGMPSLTEAQQCVVAGDICSTDCEQTL